MGTSHSTSESPQEEELPAPQDRPHGGGGGSYQWPENLYLETRDMGAVAFLVYTFGYILDVARKRGIKGLAVDDQGHATKSTTTARRLTRSFTPGEVKTIIEDNLAILAEAYPDEFETSKDVVLKSLQLLQDRATEGGTSDDRPLTLEEYDDKHQDLEMVYGVCKDSVNKRITIVFRGTENELAFGTNWATNLSMSQVEVEVPDVLKGKLSQENNSVWLHSGFYNYVFAETHEESDAPGKRKYDEILEDVRPLLNANPDYKLYCTGHSLGAALATLVSFFLACEEDIPNPVSCINFASPRVGGHSFLEAVQELEKDDKLRILRLVNDKDAIPMAPMINYSHAGFQIRLFKDAVQLPEITFPKIIDSAWNRWGRTWGNSIFASFNLSYDHGDYRERVEQNKEFLEQQDLNTLYDRGELTGFESPGV